MNKTGKSKNQTGKQYIDRHMKERDKKHSTLTDRKALESKQVLKEKRKRRPKRLCQDDKRIKNSVKKLLNANKCNFGINEPL